MTITDKTFEQHLAEVAERHGTKTGKKQRAQEMLMHGLANVLGYWTEENTFDVAVMTEDEIAEFGALLQQQADRVAKMFGYTNAWSA